VVVKAAISCRAGSAAFSDDEGNVFNDKGVTKRMISLLVHGRFGLLEKLTADLLVVTLETEQVSYAEIRVDKPHALRFPDSVSITSSASSR